MSLLSFLAQGETAGVQVKTKTNQDEFQKYLDNDYSGRFDKFFYVYHTGDVKEPPNKDNPYKNGLYIWGALKVSEKAIDAGLSQWIIDRAYK